MVYTNIISFISIKGYINAAFSTDYQIATSVIDFKESGLKKEIKNQKIYGDNIITTTENPIEMDLNITLLVDNTDNINAFIHYANNLDAIGGGITDIYSNLSDDNYRKFRFSLTWKDQDSGNYFMKVYYNVYLDSVTLINNNTLQVTITGKMPSYDITTGYGNYYEYEGTNYSGTLSTLDTRMLWSS